MLALVLRMVASLVVVLAVMGLIARVLRRSGAPAALRRGSGGGIQVLARRGLSRTSSLSLVRVGNRELLIGVTPHAISTLADLNEQLDETRGDSRREGKAGDLRGSDVQAVACQRGSGVVTASSQQVADGIGHRQPSIPAAASHGLAIRPPRSTRVPLHLTTGEPLGTPAASCSTPPRASRTAPWSALRSANDSTQGSSWSPRALASCAIESWPRSAGRTTAWIAALAQTAARFTDRSGRHGLSSGPDRSPSMPTPHAPVAGEAVVTNT